MDRQKKREQIESIDDEVNVLHPLLHDLLRKLPDVTHVENTHGPNEMGADFILECNDKHIHETYYIGVVAKTTRILQNISEIDRQVEECAVKRFIRQGKQEIRLQEVWVVTTKNYSQNAKTKIAEKYPSRKILFFDAEWLVDLVEQHLPYYWHKLPNATGSYLATLAGQIAELDTQTSLLQSPGASSKYIELDVEEYDPEQYQKSPKPHKNRVVRFIDEVLGNKISILEAEMGYGKEVAPFV